MNKYKNIWLIFFIVSTFTYAQNDYFDSSSIRYNDFIYQSTIHTPQIHKLGNELSYPFVEMNSNDTLVAQFDDFQDNIQDYYFTIIHCDKNWTPSSLSFYEYAEGFDDCPIKNYAFSFNTLQSYIHYSLTIPNEQLKIKLSGNYLLLVHHNDRSKPVLTLRFFVYEPLTQITAQAHQATLTEYRKTHQEIDFSIKNAFSCNNPFAEISVVISQNFRFDNAIYDLKPQFVKDNELIYNYEQGNLFEGGSEFRWVDSKSIRFQAERIQAIEFERPLYHYYMYPDEKRTFKVYFQWQDINGRFLVKNSMGRDSRIEADYVYVHFFLPFEAPLAEGNLYVAGNFNRWQYNNTNQMTYNYDQKRYELTLLLKQGFYDYAYAYLTDKNNQADFGFIEGNHYETENDYYIFVYWKNNSSLYERLVGVKAINSSRQ
ncbi:MAG: DUF5103 domain-containing protein [Bacteroidales bacterium]|nr:DUF5103 domain-containing protein [Bacteroidales bacterium]